MTLGAHSPGLLLAVAICPACSAQALTATPTARSPPSESLDLDQGPLVQLAIRDLKATAWSSDKP